MYWLTPSHETVLADHVFLIKSATVGVGVTGVGAGSLPLEPQLPRLSAQIRTKTNVNNFIS